MTFHIGLISDIHAYPAPLKEALSIFKQQKVDSILCAGDIAGYGDALDAAVKLLIASPCQSILGNHEIWYIEKFTSHTDPTTQYFKSLPHSLDLNVEDKTIYMVHASPPDRVEGGIRLLDEHGAIIPQQKQFWTTQLVDFNYDVLIVGHTHQAFAEQLGTTLVINPGSTSYNHSCAILKLPDMTVEFYPLSNQNISTTWNWGNHQINSRDS